MPTTLIPSGDVCRFFKGKQFADISKLVDRNLFNLKRKTGYEYLNTYSILWAQLFLRNHDIRKCLLCSQI